MLCNFDEIWVYDFDLQLEEPVDRIRIVDLPERYTALNFMFPEEKRPLFGNDRVAVTRAAADKVAAVFNAIIGREVDRKVAQRFILQCVVAMFSEDAGLLPSGLFTQLLHDCKAGQSSYDLIGGLFKQMNNPTPAPAGLYKGVPYFNGGVFAVVEPLQLAKDEIEALLEAVQEDWSKVQPVIFGSLFESSMDAKERHAYGAHFTSEADIQKVVMPTIVRPWQEKIEKAKTFADLRNLRQELLNFRVLDPACGSGNFLYVAYRELKHIELDVLTKMHNEFPKQAQKEIESATSLISTRQFFGLDNNPFAVELAKVTLMLAKELTIKEVAHTLENAQQGMAFDYEPPLPLDNLDKNIMCADALFTEWPKADAIIGNPPYQSKNKMQKEFGPAYVNKLRAAYPDVPGRADYCVYWFRKAHDNLQKDGRAGLVGTNTIRQNYSREGSLDYIVANGGTIIEAVSTQVWSGDASVHVSIVDWIKGKQTGKKPLYTQKGDSLDSPWEKVELDEINSSLSYSLDVSDAVVLAANSKSEVCYQGQTHGHEGFLLAPEEAKKMIGQNAKNAEVLFPYLTGDDLLSFNPPTPQRFVIDFHPKDILTAGSFREPFDHIKGAVLPTREAALKEETERNAEMLKENPKAKVNRHHQNFLKKWWLLSYAREELIAKLSRIPRYVACSRVTKRPVFEFISSAIRPSDALQVFAIADDYSFGILQSGIHWLWFTDRCSTLKGDFRYTSNTVFDTFPWPQNPNVEIIKKVSTAAVHLRMLRNDLMKKTDSTLRDLYRSLELPGENPLRDSQLALDIAVREAYGMQPDDDVLTFLLKLNKSLAAKEVKGGKVTGPGLPASIKNPQEFVTADCISCPTP
jgi:SAM-dependent methyltransferase